MDETKTLPQKLCAAEGGSDQIDIAQAHECLRVLADLFVNDEDAFPEFWKSWVGAAMKRHDAHLAKMLGESLVEACTPPDPED